MAQEDGKIVVQTRLGERAVDPERVLTFPKGIIGFEQCREFTLLQLKDNSPFVLLQCLDDPTLGLMMANPFEFMESFEVRVGDAEQRILQIDSIEEVAVLVTLTIPRGRPQEASLNLSGPVLVNIKNRVGLQVPQTDPRQPSHFNLSDVAK